LVEQKEVGGKEEMGEAEIVLAILKPRRCMDAGKSAMSSGVFWSRF
jgi:hypothetical protein